MTEEDIKKLQSTGGEDLAAVETNILGNHLPDLWNLVSSPSFGRDKKVSFGEAKKGGRVDFGSFLFSLFRSSCSLLHPVLDNAGFGTSSHPSQQISLTSHAAELYCDCVYADWLIQSGLASQVRFHGKRFAWFVSDVTRQDWKWLFNSMVVRTFSLSLLSSPTPSS